METSLDRASHSEDALRLLHEELDELRRRVVTLEAARSAAPGAASATAAAPEAHPAEAEVSDEVLAVLSAAVAAFLGHKPHIRQIRVGSSASWAQQGRVTIQASHALAQHAR